ncbi:MAG: 50S ribosome-binding GTPase, partial [Blastocatellia bacterium]|nr:50S ribosome-binding GTPase [Blastocatellia bacterium]
TFVVADIPGLIEGASEGAGLGLQFLRHVERTKLLLHLVDVSSSTGRDPVEDYKIVSNELRSYKEDLSERPEIVVANKVDALDEPERLQQLKDYCRNKGLPLLIISAVTGEGLKELVFTVQKVLEQIQASTLEGSQFLKGSKWWESPELEGRFSA